MGNSEREGRGGKGKRGEAEKPSGGRRPACLKREPRNEQRATKNEEKHTRNTSVERKARLSASAGLCIRRNRYCIRAAAEQTGEIRACARARGREVSYGAITGRQRAFAQLVCISVQMYR